MTGDPKARKPNPRKPRSDKNKPRVRATRQPKTLMIYLAGHGIEAKVLNAIEGDLARKKKEDPDANEKTILMEWLTDYLGLNGD